MLDQYADAPRRLRQIIETIAPEHYDIRPIPGRMSTRELVCHLADFELIGADRLKRVISEHSPRLLAYDQDTMLNALQYADRDVEEELQLIESIRRHTAAILRPLPSEAWQRVGTHAEAGEMTLTGLFRRVTSHFTHHLPFLEEKSKALSSRP